MQAIRQYLFRICFLAICAILFAVILLPIGLAKAETGEEVKHKEKAKASEQIQAQINIKVEDILNVKGIGQKILEDNLDMMTVGVKAKTTEEKEE